MQYFQLEHKNIQLIILSVSSWDERWKAMTRETRENTSKCGTHTSTMGTQRAPKIQTRKLDHANIECSYKPQI